MENTQNSLNLSKNFLFRSSFDEKNVVDLILSKIKLNNLYIFLERNSPVNREQRIVCLLKKMHLIFLKYLLNQFYDINQ